MTNKALLDTTVVHDQLLGDKKKKASTKTFLAGYSDTRTVVYSFKEFRAGPLATWILAHNKLAEAKSLTEAAAGIHAAGQFAPRKSQVGIIALIRAIEAADKAATVPQQTQLQAVRAHLGAAIVRAWNKRKSAAGKVSEPLSCFVQDDIVLTGKKLWPKGGTLGCQPNVVCSAALHLLAHEADIEKLVAVLRPPKNAAPQKPEHGRIRAALKEVLDSSRGDFDRRKCRALGDAYFCLMAEVGEDIVTTNKGDFDLLSKVLGKRAVNP